MDPREPVVILASDEEGPSRPCVVKCSRRSFLQAALPLAAPSQAASSSPQTSFQSESPLSLQSWSVVAPVYQVRPVALDFDQALFGDERTIRWVSSV